jgi:hypothetical protein
VLRDSATQDMLIVSERRPGRVDVTIRSPLRRRFRVTFHGVGDDDELRVNGVAGTAANRMVEV